jgi:hypothetical protein
MMSSSREPPRAWFRREGRARTLARGRDGWQDDTGWWDRRPPRPRKVPIITGRLTEHACKARWGLSLNLTCRAGGAPPQERATSAAHVHCIDVEKDRRKGPLTQGRTHEKTEEEARSDWTCSPMVGQSSGTLPTRVQILVLAPFPGFSRIYRRYALSGKRHSHRWRGAIGDFGNLQICQCSVLRRCS